MILLILRYHKNISVKIQPEYPVPDIDENGELLLGPKDITIFKEADGTYTIHVDGTGIYIPISESEQW
ncbi:MAG: hypothetical protein ACI4EH_03485 [Oliverpabstia sp.]